MNVICEGTMTFFCQMIESVIFSDLVISLELESVIPDQVASENIFEEGIETYDWVSGTSWASWRVMGSEKGY